MMARQTNSPLEHTFRALRLPFITASALPFIFGSLINGPGIDAVRFSLGLIAVVSAHLSANLINDYADSRSGADWHDGQFYGLFGGSKLIQEGILTEGFYLRLAAFFAASSALAVAALAMILSSPFVIAVFAVVTAAAWSYSAKPLQLSYHFLGEPVIFILFGPVPVMAGYFLQTGIFPDIKSFMLSLPFGFMTAAILYANEVPDLPDDARANKHNWAALLGPRKAYIGYCLLMTFAFVSIIYIVLRYAMNPAAFSVLLTVPAALKAAAVLKGYRGDKRAMLWSSKATIAVHAIASIVLILGVVI